jgi:hypothetical protein
LLPISHEAFLALDVNIPAKCLVSSDKSHLSSR